MWVGPSTMGDFSVLGEIGHDLRSFADSQLSRYNATELKNKMDALLDGNTSAWAAALMNYSTSTTTVAPDATTLIWTPEKIAVVTAVIVAMTVCLVLATIIYCGALFGSKGLTGADVLVFNHCTIDLLMGLLVLPLALVTKYALDGAFPGSLTLCHAW